MAIKLKTAPAVEPVSLTEAKAYLRISDTDDDALISALITAARQRCEEWTGRALVTQTWTLWLDGFPREESPGAPKEGYFELPFNHFDRVKDRIELPRPPLQSVTHLKTYDTADAPSTLSAANYFVDTASVPGRIILNSGQSWPSTALRPGNGIEIEYVAGYGSAGSDVPDMVKQGMLLWIKHQFANKSKLFEGDESTPGLAEFNALSLPAPVMAMWSPYKLVRL